MTRHSFDFERASKIFITEMARGKRVSCLTKNVLLVIAASIVANYINSFLANATNNLITAFQEEKNGNKEIVKGTCFINIDIQ